MESERLRAEQFERFATSLERHGALRPGLGAAKATDVLLTMASGYRRWQEQLAEGFSQPLHPVIIAPPPQSRQL
jgi:hypothetical protein